ncbi:MAG: spore germination protein GerW family protein [Actinomycetota bacterium]|nr:spore germination protein GerW family protein [Actinomycetota bacterium]
MSVTGTSTGTRASTGTKAGTGAKPGTAPRARTSAETGAETATGPEASGAPGAAASLLGHLADQLGGKASVRAAYGDPVVGEGVTVIPVARVGFGFGGGLGRGPARPRRQRRNGPEPAAPGTGEGGGGGGGAEARPLGFIEIRDGSARYRPIRDPWSDVILPLALLVAGILAPKAARLALRQRRRG